MYLFAYICVLCNSSSPNHGFLDPLLICINLYIRGFSMFLISFALHWRGGEGGEFTSFQDNIIRRGLSMMLTFHTNSCEEFAVCRLLFAMWRALFASCLSGSLGSVDELLVLMLGDGA